MKPEGTSKRISRPRFPARLLVSGCFLLGCAARPPSGPPHQASTGPAVLLVAIDGFHPDYLERQPSRHLRRLAREGVRARWMVPVFPTLTFPNFHTIATGLYPERHGIVSNTMKDPVLGRFATRNSAAVRDPRWWGGEPIWVTAAKQGKRTAAFFWPGTETPIGGVLPTHFRRYDSKVPNAVRVGQVLDWLSAPEDQAPALVTLYLGDVDRAGHDFGPAAPETDSAIAAVDSAIGALVLGLERLGLDRRVNLIVVSDHGMAEVPRENHIYLDDLVDTASVEIVEWGPAMSLFPRRGTVDDVVRQLSGAHPRLEVYRKSEVPERYGYRSHPRIPPILALADEGWMVITRGEVASRGGRLSRGQHGYPPDVPSMRALFLARGPAFSTGAVVEPFQNIHVYPMLVHLLGLTAAQTDGSLDSIKSVLK